MKHSGLHSSHSQGGSRGVRSKKYQQGGGSAAGAGGAKAGFAYKHPFAADKLGMQNLVMAEFSQVCVRVSVGGGGGRDGWMEGETECLCEYWVMAEQASEGEGA